MITLEPTSAVAPFEQIRRQISDQIRAGDLHGGQRLPSIRQLAADLRVAPGTVAKAYASLEDDGLLETSRSRGTRVLPNQTHPEEIQQAAATFVQSVGDLDLEDVLSAIRTAWLARRQPNPGQT